MRIENIHEHLNMKERKNCATNQPYRNWDWTFICISNIYIHPKKKFETIHTHLMAINQLGSISSNEEKENKINKLKLNKIFTEMCFCVWISHKMLKTSWACVLFEFFLLLLLLFNSLRYVVLRLNFQKKTNNFMKDYKLIISLHSI